jgi:hypothetical protein
MCIYFYIRAVKTQATICQIVSLCNIQEYVTYNYMFRPCKRAIIRLFLEPVTGLYNRSMGGRDLVLHHVLYGYMVVNIYIDVTTIRQYKCLQPYNHTKYDVRRDLVPPYSYCIVQLLVQGTTWWWPPYKAETCSCMLHTVVYYTVILSDILFLVFWPHVYKSIYTFYAVLT